MIVSLETTNFRKLGNFKANFLNGTNLIIGPNGQGKSTIFQAIRFALFGLSSIEAEADEIPTWGERTCEVRLAFSDFYVVRTMKDCKVFRRGDDGSYTDDAKYKVAEGNSPATKFIKDMLKMDHKLFDIFFMSMQGETGALITYGVTDLNRIVEDISGIGILDKVIKSVSKETTQNEGALGTVEYIDPTELKAEVDEATKVKEGFEAEKESLQRDLDVVSQNLKNVNNDIEFANDNNQRIARNKLHAENLRGRLSQVTEALELAETKLEETKPKVKSVDGLIVERDTITDTLKQFDKDNYKHDQLSATIEEHTKAAEDAEKKAPLEEATKIQARKLEDDLKAARQSVERQVVSLEKWDEKIEQVEKELKDGVCSKCNRPFDDFDPDKMEERLKGLRAERAEETSQLSKLNKLVRSIDEEISQLPDYGTNNAEAAEMSRKIIEQEKKELEDLEAKWEEFDYEESESRRDKLNQEIAEAKVLANELKEYEANVEKFSEMKSEMESQLSEYVEEEPTDLKPLHERRDKLRPQHDELMLQVTNAFNRLAQSQETYIHSKHRLDKVLSDNEAFSTYSKDVSIGKELVKFLRNSRTDYMDGVWTMILGVASEFVNNTTKGWITEIGRNEKGKFTFTQDGIVSTVKGSASGAQKEFIGTAIRIGLSSCLYGSNALMMLDEPTAGMVEENADKLASGLLSVHGQKIIITHRQSERLTAANVINLS